MSPPSFVSSPIHCCTTALPLAVVPPSRMLMKSIPMTAVFHRPSPSPSFFSFPVCPISVFSLSCHVLNALMSTRLCVTRHHSPHNTVPSTMCGEINNMNGVVVTFLFPFVLPRSFPPPFLQIALVRLSHA
jgi:hypothetical protein